MSWLKPIHIAELDVADAVIDLEQAQALRGGGRLLDRPVTGSEEAVIVGPIDEGMQDLAVGVHRAAAERAVLPAVQLGRLLGADCSTGGRLAPGAGRVVDAEGDVVDPVAVPVDVLGDL